MGSLIHDIFGGSSSKSSSQSGNNAFPWAQSTFGPSAGTDFNGGSSALAGLLGVGGNPSSAASGLDNFFNSAGGQFQLNNGIDAVNSNMYARGLGKSGADMKGLESFRQGLASTYMQNYITDLLGLSNLGLGAGQLVTGAGNFSKGSSSGDEETGNLGKGLGALLSFI